MQFDFSDLLAASHRRAVERGLASALLLLSVCAVVGVGLHFAVTRRVERLSASLSDMEEGHEERVQVLPGNGELAVLSRGMQRTASIVRARRETMQRAATQYRVLFSESPVPMWILDGSREAMLAINAAAREHFDVSDDALDDLDARAYHGEDLHTAIHSGSAAGRIWTLPRRGDTPALAEVATQPLTFEGQQALLVAAFDVTQREQALQEVEAHQCELEQRVAERTRDLERALADLVRTERLAALGQLTATVAHELRNPLGTIRGVLFLLAEQSPATEGGDRPPALRRAERAIARCDQILAELLDYARENPLSRKVTDLDAWLPARLAERELPPGITLRFETAAGELVDLDRERFGRCLTNLIDNATEAITGRKTHDPHQSTDATPGTITVSTAANGEEVRIQVSDTGPGIDAAQREQIFDPLFSTKSFGVGLGLPTAKRIVEQHDGELRLRSGTHGGAVFEVTLPRHRADTSQDQPPPGHGGSGERNPDTNPKGSR